MKVSEKNRQEVEAKLRMMSDFLKMEYLESCMKQNSSLDVKKFCHQKLSELYEGRNMLAEAARNMSSAAEMAATFSEKIQAYIKETELWIKATQYDRADEAFRKALASGNTREKEEMKKSILDLYRKQAAEYEKAKRNSNALKIYEKLVEMVPESERRDVKLKLLDLYKALGKIREYTSLKNQLG
jgi:tetratricopeptide (TPR) repeat protein